MNFFLSSFLSASHIPVIGNEKAAERERERERERESRVLELLS